MRVEFYEKILLWLTVAVEAAFLVAIFIAVTQNGIVLPGPTQRVDPQTVKDTPPWNNPGVTQTAPAEYDVIMRAQAKSWQFMPAKLEVPSGSSVTFRLVSEDVIHGFKIKDTTVNVMVIPGEVSLVRHTFKEPGEYVYICHEYCGVGHQAMYGVLTVTGTAQLPRDGQTAAVAAGGQP